MEIIPEESFQKGGYVPNGKRHPVANALLTLAVGEILRISAADWTWKSRSPATIARRIANATGREFVTYKQNGVRAWAIRRIG